MLANRERLLQMIETRQEELWTLLAKLVSFETVSPPARNASAAQKFVTTYFDELGYETEATQLYQGDDLVVATKKGSQGEDHHSLIINGHMDVAAIGNASAWQTEPFQLREQGDTLVGRGVSDMKGALAADLFVLRLINELEIPLKGDLQFQSVVGEEAGEAGTRTLLEKGHRADFAIVNDTSDLEFHGQGGCVTGWVTIKSPETYHDGNRRQMIHAGGGLDSASTIEKMQVIIQGLQSLERHWGVTKSYPGFPPGTTTINPAYIEGGIHPAFVADECRLWITVHFYPNEELKTIQEEVTQQIMASALADPWLKNNLPTVEWGGRSMIEDQGEVFPSAEYDPEEPAIQSLALAYEQVMGKAPKMTMSPSVTDAGWFAEFGIPTLIFGPGKLQEAHSDNETLKKQDLINFAKTMAVFVVEWCNQKR